MNEPGVYRSDVEGHLLLLRLDPVSVTCVACVDTCSRSRFKTLQEFRRGATEFVGKHGALDGRIASSIVELVPPRPAK